VIARLQREEAGFGLIELVIALAVLNVVILALFATFNAGSLSLQRANLIATAETLADKQMELYRAQVYKGIGLESGLVGAVSDTTHTGDPAWISAASQYTDNAQTGCTAVAPECQPVQASVTGADGRTYRIDSYVRALAAGSGPANGREVKAVTVVVRSSAGKALARLTTTFDKATGCTGKVANPC
jgi:type II secretory pathway pseudopilin PulG